MDTLYARAFTFQALLHTNVYYWNGLANKTFYTNSPPDISPHLRQKMVRLNLQSEIFTISYCPIFPSYQMNLKSTITFLIESSRTLQFMTTALQHGLKFVFCDYMRRKRGGNVLLPAVISSSRRNSFGYHRDKILKDDYHYEAAELLEKADISYYLQEVIGNCTWIFMWTEERVDIASILLDHFSSVLR